MDSERYYNLSDRELTLEFCPPAVTGRTRRRAQSHAYIEAYRRFWERVYFMAFKHLKTTASAEEVVHEVFLFLWKRRQEFVIESLPEHVAVITRYMVYRYLAKLKMIRLAIEEVPKGIDVQSGFTSDLIHEIIQRGVNDLPEEFTMTFQPVKDIPLFIPRRPGKLRRTFKKLTSFLRI